jgi:hypothetical protein
MSVLAWYWPNAIYFTQVGWLVAKLDADKIGSSRSETHVGKITGTQTYTIFKKGEDFSITIDGVVKSHDSLRQRIVDNVGDILCSDFNYLVFGPSTDVDIDLPDDLSNMTEDEQIAWSDANMYYLVKDANGEKIKFFLRDAITLSSIEDVQNLKNKKWCKSGGGGSGGGMVFFGIAIAAIIAIVLYSKLAAKKR